MKTMKNIYAFLVAACTLAFAATSCHTPEYVSPTADRQGITSLTAWFTFGPYRDQEMGKLTIDDEYATRFEIPIPYYYPETSDDPTEPYMTKVKVTAELQPNCSIEPPLTILDLTQDNIFTYTDAAGDSYQIVITGKRTHSSACELLSFSIVSPVEVTGIIDKVNKKVSLITIDDLSEAIAEYEVSPHATISPDPTEAQDYNDGMTFTVTAADGVTTATYTVAKSTPTTISYGFNNSSVAQLFNFEPTSNLGTPAYTETIYPSLAILGKWLVFCTGDGSAPIYINKLNGATGGTVTAGSASWAAITSDEGGHMLISNHAENGETFTIWKTSSVDAAPEEFYSMTNTSGLPMGYSIKVIGNIDSEARITVTNEGIPEVTASTFVTDIIVSGGEVTGVTVTDISASGLTWGGAPVNASKIAPMGVATSRGWIGSCYDPNIVTWVKEDGSAGATMPTSNGNSWGWNAVFFDASQFNNATYACLLVSSHFPSWGIGPGLYMYDVTDTANLTGEFTSSPALALANDAIDWYQTGGYAVAAADVLVAPSADGYSLYVYYYDHNAGVLGGYYADCLE